MFCDKHFEHSTPGIEDRIQLYQRSICRCQHLVLFSPYFFFPISQPDTICFSLSRGYYLYLQKLHIIAPLDFLWKKYLAMSLINPFLHYCLLSQGNYQLSLITFPPRISTPHRPAHPVPHLAHFTTTFYAAFWGHILQLVLHHILCHVSQSASHLILGPVIRRLSWYQIP